METYSQLYPNKQIEVANQLDELMAKNITSDVANLQPLKTQNPQKPHKTAVFED